MPTAREPDERPRATVAETRALAHPLRLRIIRLLFDRELTNRELARSLGENPATVLHHVRTLLRTGFIEPAAERRGPRGTTEKPYRSTGRSWTLAVDDAAAGVNVSQASFEAFLAELRDSEPNADLRTSRLAMTLTRPNRIELEKRIARILDEYARLPRDPDGDGCAIFIATHLRAGSARDASGERTDGDPPAVVLRECASDDATAALLVRAQWAELGARYGQPEPAPASIRDPAAFTAPNGAFFVLRVGADDVACGGICRSDADTAEIKAVYVLPTHRGHGYSHLVLQALEDRAVALGYCGVRLETGDAQPEAIALYERRGYEHIECFGQYAELPRSVCFARRFEAAVLEDDPYGRARCARGS
ncbi:MAG TPA: GNAT family N-acetyltransferase [Acidimicrobiia bacterium]|jgi:GNAT superfamily N-acetyltransferase/DNA-binding transcriptional ArsR family regulator|nr:GNAT family N-acetyltransferase [Acidimicrobiia bacterium]